MYALKLLIVIAIALALAALRFPGVEGNVRLNESALYLSKSVLPQQEMLASSQVRNESLLQAALPKSSCLQLTYYILLDRWRSVSDLNKAGSCKRQNILTTRTGVTEVLHAIDMLDQGRKEDALRHLHYALIRGGMKFSPSILPLLQEASLPLDTALSTWPDWPTKDATQPSSPHHLGILGIKDGSGQWVEQSIVVSANWSLLSYEIIEADMEAGLPIRTRLWWQAISPEATPPVDWISAGRGVWIEDVLLQNALPNGSLEWEDAELGRIPSTFRDSFHSDHLRHLAVEERNGKGTYVIKLEEDPEGKTSGFINPQAIDVDASCWYLVGIWLRSNGAGPGLEMVWSNTTQNAEPDDRVKTVLAGGTGPIGFT